ncbi:MAG: DMT family transporter [Thermoguttaceae bacterium]
MRKAYSITNRSRSSLRFRSDALLLLTALLWGSAFIPQRLAAQTGLGAFLFNGLRFLLGAMILLPWVRPFRLPSKTFIQWALIAGTLLVVASVCQQAGMKYTTAGNAGFITGLYVVLVPVVMYVGWRQRVGWRRWAGTLIATAGVFLLGVNEHFRIQPGDALEIFGALFWALHVVIVGRAVKRVNVLLFSVGQYFVAGALNLIIGLTLEADTLPRLGDCWWAVAYVGVFSVAIGYTLQAVGQKFAPAADAAIILSMEAVFAALLGYVLLNETLIPRQLVGCALILAAMVVVQLNDVGNSAGT